MPNQHARNGQISAENEFLAHLQRQFFSSYEKPPSDLETAIVMLGEVRSIELWNAFNAGAKWALAR